MLRLIRGEPQYAAGRKFVRANYACRSSRYVTARKTSRARCTGGRCCDLQVTKTVYRVRTVVTGQMIEPSSSASALSAGFARSWRRPQQGTAIDQLTRRIEVTGVNRGLGHRVQDDLPHIRKPPADQVFRPPGRSRVQVETARTAPAAPISCWCSSKAASAGSSGEGRQPVGSLRSTGAPAATPRNQNRSSSTARCRGIPGRVHPDGRTGRRPCGRSWPAR